MFNKSFLSLSFLNFNINPIFIISLNKLNFNFQYLNIKKQINSFLFSKNFNLNLKISNSYFFKFLNSPLIINNNNYENMIYNSIRPNIFGINITINNCNFNLCSSIDSNGGGAFYLFGSSINLNVYYSLFINCTSSYSGGGFHVLIGSLIVKKVCFVHCKGGPYENAIRSVLENQNGEHVLNLTSSFASSPKWNIGWGFSWYLRNGFIKSIECNSSFETSSYQSGPDYYSNEFIYVRYIQVENNTGYCSFSIENSPLNHIIDYCNLINNDPKYGIIGVYLKNSKITNFYFLKNFFNNQLIYLYGSKPTGYFIFENCKFDQFYSQTIILSNQVLYTINSCFFSNSIISPLQFKIYNSFLCGNNYQLTNKNFLIFSFNNFFFIILLILF